MKIIVAILTSFFSLFTGSDETVKESICGVWKGSYGSENEIINITVKIDPQNKIELLRSDAGIQFSAKGTYQLVGDSAIIIYCTFNETGAHEIKMYGNLNRSVSFIDGQWDGTGKEKGCFYLQKQPIRDNL